jgi:hypothetical protein
MHDGTELQFPDDTTDAVIQATVKRQLSMPLSEVATQAASNFIPSMGGQVVNVVKAAIHPIDTLTNLHKVISGAAQNMLPESLQPESRKGDRDAANAIAELYKNNYGSAEGFKHHLASDPGAVMMDASALLTGGAGLAGKIPALAKPAAIAMEAGTKVNPLYVPAILARQTARGAARGAAQVAPVIADAVSPTGQAATLIKRDFPDGNIPTQAPSLLRDMPANFVGAPVPKFGYAGVEPTAAMISDNPNILRMEMNARNRNPTGFFQKDNNNTKSIYSMLQENAISDKDANILQDALNAKTGPLREAAFSEARAYPTFRGELANLILNKANQPGIRGSKSMPIINRAKGSLMLEDLGGGNIASRADPLDIYTLRKELGDSLNSKNIVPDEMANAAKSNRRLTSELMSNIDYSLNDSSGGAFNNYLKSHSEGMKPIEQGRSFQNIVDTFDNKPRIYGTDIPQITPYALRKAVDDNTFFNAGKKGYTSTIGDTQRTKVTDAVDAMNALEAAKKGTVSVTGSPTATFAASLMKEGLARVPGAGLPTKIISVAKALGELRGQKALDDALLNPEKLQTILDKYHARNKL